MTWTSTPAQIPLEAPLARPYDDDDPDCEAALGGDAQAWSALIVRHGPTVRRYLLSRGLSHQAAEELQQEVWLRLMLRARQGQLERIKMPGLVLAEARFRLLDEWRRARRDAAQPTLDPEVLDRLEDTEPGPEQLLVAARRQARLRLAIADLPPRMGEIFGLYYRGALDCPTIAARLDITVQRVRSTLTEARQRLRAALEAA